eukprot:Hpha_TRINITY_DN36070_c0_g1::TRINITY_DN36070_c0_g1_i1::g.170780::m.170780
MDCIDALRRSIIDSYIELEAVRGKLPTYADKAAAAAQGMLEVGPKLPCREDVEEEQADTLSQLEELFQRTYALDAEIASVCSRGRSMTERLETEAFTQRVKDELTTRRDLLLQQEELMCNRLRALCSYIHARVNELKATCPRDPIGEFIESRERKKQEGLKRRKAQTLREKSGGTPVAGERRRAGQNRAAALVERARSRPNLGRGGGLQAARAQRTLAMLSLS